MAQRGVGGTPPGGVDLAAEAAHVERRHRLTRRVVAHRGGQGGLGRGTTPVPPPGEQLDDLVVVRHRRRLRDDAARRVAHQHPVQRRRDGVLGRRPPADDLGLGAGDGDVQQAQPLAGLLVGPTAAVVGPVGPTAADVEAAPPLVVVEQRSDRLRDVPVGDRGEVDDGVLEPLAGVDGHQLDRGGVGVEPSGPLGTPPGAALGHLLAQPGQQRHHAEAVALGHLVECLADVAQVGEPAFAADLGQHPAGQTAGVRRLEHRGDPAPAEDLGPGPQPVGHLVGEVVTPPVELGGRVTEEAGQCGGPDPGAAVRLLERLEQGQPLHGGRGGEDAAAPGDHRRHPHASRARRGPRPGRRACSRSPPRRPARSAVLRTSHPRPAAP